MTEKTITLEQLEAILFQWAIDSRVGRTLTYEESAALSADQVAKESAEWFWSQIPEAVVVEEPLTFPPLWNVCDGVNVPDFGDAITVEIQDRAGNVYESPVDDEKGADTLYLYRYSPFDDFSGDRMAWRKIS